MSKPTVYVCRGGDCRDRKRPRRRLLEALEGHAKVQEVGCQKICDGPVCGVEVDGTLEWFEEVDSEKALDALLGLLQDGKLRKALKKRRVGSKRGRLR